LAFGNTQRECLGILAVFFQDQWADMCAVPFEGFLHKFGRGFKPKHHVELNGSPLVLLAGRNDGDTRKCLWGETENVSLFHIGLAVFRLPGTQTGYKKKVSSVFYTPHRLPVAGFLVLGVGFFLLFGFGCWLGEFARFRSLPETVCLLAGNVLASTDVDGLYQAFTPPPPSGNGTDPHFRQPV